MIKKALTLLVCLTLLLNMAGIALAEETDLTAGEDLTAEEKAQWEEWAQEENTEENTADEAAKANSIEMTEEEKAQLSGLTTAMEESAHLDEVDLTNLDKNESLPKDVFNILLLGVDNRSTELERGRTDAIMICSVNLNTGAIKMVSIARDTAAVIPGLKQMGRINTAYMYGGAELSMKTVNQNYQMNVDRYVTVNIHGLAAIIDALGGVDMDMTAREANRINFELRKEPMDKVKRESVKRLDGVQHLDGMQAVTFARIRAIDSDLERTRRQRQLLETLLEKVMVDMDISKLMTLIETSLPYGDTNLTIDELLTLGMAVMGSEAASSDGEWMEQMRVPMDKHYGWQKFGDFALLYLNEKNLKYTIETMQEFLYGQSYYIEAAQ
ncbi:MAG: LCP family protein [Eubacteriales bacterium]|nr:LCP family protein [Eubacteriales bacterium]